jgi:hypothetical protein
MRLKKFINLYLEKITNPKLLEFGINDVYVKGLLHPGNKLGAVFIFTEPNAPEYYENYKKIKKIIELDVWDSISLFSESPEDWAIYLNKLPLKPLDESLPFKEVINHNERIRTFLESTNDEEFKWHQDNEDRLVSTIHETDWMIQLDDELPIKLEVGKQILIPEGVWHRIIKGTGDLQVKVVFI